MALSARPQRRNLAVRINRSQSFAGVNSTQDKGFRNCPAFSTPTVSRKSSSRVSRMFSMSHKSPPPKVPQPERLDEVYEALKKGITAYVDMYQLELEKLNIQIRESKRNSRLGFLYDLDKQVKANERFLRRLEFHASKIDELYEAYCIQRRLRDGAHNMVKAYTAASPGSKEARESLAEASKGYKEYTKNMCLLESELEGHLGEFHIKMKGLAGFARLCAGDQYEIFMKYGRQRWKLRGRIKANNKQVWDSEEMIFLPLITEFLSMKVTELKSLASYAVVVKVSCETKDLFAALPQVVAVDIDDLGTKLSLEVNWNPFDKEDQPPSANTVNKTSSVHKRFSTYNQSPPDTPSMREQAFDSFPRLMSPKPRWALLDIFRETLLERLPRSCSCSDVSSVQLDTRALQDSQKQGVCLSRSSSTSLTVERADDSSSPQLSGSVRHIPPRPVVPPAVQVAAPAIEMAFTQPEDKDPPAVQEEVVAMVVANGHVPYARTLSQISEASVDLPVSQDRECAAAPQERSPGDLPALEMNSLAQGAVSMLDTRISECDEEEAEFAGAAIVVTETSEDAVGQSQEAPEPQASLTEPKPDSSVDLPPAAVLEVPRSKPVDCGLEEAINCLASALDDYRGQFPELQSLEQELKHLEEILLQKPGVCLSRSSSTSLTVERALESFNFLNAAEMDDSEGDEEGRPGSVQPLSRVPGSGEAVGEETPGCCPSEGSSEPMSTGSEFLDRALVLHLNYCNGLLLKRGNFGPLRCQEMYALDRLAREAQVLETVCRLAEEQPGTANGSATEGRPSRWTSTMALSARPQRRNLAVRINRSQSFAGVNSTQDKGFRNCPAFSTPTVSRKSSSRVSRMFSMSHKSPPKVPQPERLDEVYEALKKGITAYVDMYQLELEKLNIQIRESKRNSRLGFLYDLDKQVKANERFLRRLEFHASKIDELYEAYCIQRRLRDGAHNMVKAYTAASPGSKEARESLAKASKGYKEYTKNMCLLESELEGHLGEFHIKMKGLAGFARLCAGDQYEIFMKYGRQRWKLRGRIKANNKQVWDSEEMIFLPLITEFLSMKVTELKSLASYAVVVKVSCETKDLFAALPQVVAVDIDDLGTKLSLEVNWNPFDKEDQPPSANTVNKTSSVHKRFSTYNQSPPDTPSMREQAFDSFPRLMSPKPRWALLDIFRETLLERLPRSCSCSDVSSVQLGTRALQDSQKQGVCLSRSSSTSLTVERADDSSSPQLSGSVRHIPPRPVVPPAVQVAAPAIEMAFTQPEDKDPPAVQEEVVAMVVANGHVPYARTLSQISEASVDLPVSQDRECAAAPQERSPGDLPALEMNSLAQGAVSLLDTRISECDEEEAEFAGAAIVVTETSEDAVGQSQEAPEPQASLTEPKPDSSVDLPPAAVWEVPRSKPVDCGLEEAINCLASALDDYRGQFPELQSLEQELKHLEEILLQKPGVCLSRSSSTSLTVEHALESFNFLNAAEMDDSEGDEEGRPGSVQPLSRVPGSGEAVGEETPGCCPSEGSSEPLSTGSEFLDRALVLHLNYCNGLLLKRGNFGPLRCQEMYALDRLAREAQVLETVCRLAEEQPGTANGSATEGEDGKSAHRRLEESFDSLPRIFAPGSMASTAF